MDFGAIGHFDVLQAKKAYQEGKNITELLRAKKNLTVNTPDIIEVAYDIQAGSYIEYVTSHESQSNDYAAELAQVLDRHVGQGDSLLDIGTGEITTLSLVVKHLQNTPSDILAFDISWSRIFKGLAFAREHMGQHFADLKPFVADIGEIPLLDKSIDITTSSHALEPNGGNLENLLKELFRVTRKMLVLFEPSYELNSEAGRERMDRLGYIKDMEGAVRRLGGSLLDKITIKNISNPLNPTVGHVIRPPQSPEGKHPVPQPGFFSVPGTHFPLRLIDNFYYSDITGFCYPIIQQIPVFKSRTAILASALND